MKIKDLRDNKEVSGEIISIEANLTIGSERYILTLSSGYKVTLFIRELDEIRPLPIDLSFISIVKSRETE